MTKIISLGGSIIVQDKININFLKRFKDLIIKHSKKEKIIIVAGGGKTCRDYVEAAEKLAVTDDTNLCWVGIRSTLLNAELVRVIFGGKAHKKVLQEYSKKISTNKKILVGGGWKPGCSSDMDAVLAANIYKADKIINLSNINYLYDKDPKKFSSAKPIKHIKWNGFMKIVDKKWAAGGNYPFDPVASKKAQSLKLKVIIAKGTNLKNLKNILEEKKFTGTLIE